MIIESRKKKHSNKIDFCEQNFIDNFTVDFTVYENKKRTKIKSNST